MAPYLGEIRMFAGNFAPAGWAFCNGQTMPISENDALFILIGTTYGGDGQETFQLPNLQSRIPIHWGNSTILAETGGVESVTLTTAATPIHNHTVLANNGNATSLDSANNLAASPPSAGTLAYGTDSPQVFLDPGTIPPVGGNQPHENCQPFLCINYIISLFGIFPSPT
jgi:microcystin-dependent protein